jgi:GMP synthase-like glutamine amidotransferase
MIIGILQADSVMENLQPVHGNYPGMFTDVLGYVDSNIEFRHYDVEHGEYPEDLNECDGYVITGSKKSVYDDEPWIHVLSTFVLQLHEHKKKIVGICFGHQLIAQALGGRTEAADVGWGVGVHDNQVVKNEAFMEPQIEGFALVVSHKDQVSELPLGAELLATSDFCPNAMFRIDDHILTFQGHPEFTKAYSKELMEMREEILGKEKFRAGMNSLSRSHDGETISSWIVRFIAS